MRVETTVNTFNTPERLDAFVNHYGVETMLEIGGVAQGIIQTRTQLGRDASGNAFVAYSTKPFSAPVARRPPGYPAPTGGRVSKSGKTMFFEGGWKQLKGASGRGTTPNLSYSNQMLSDTQVRATEDTVVLYFDSAESAAKAHGHHFGRGFAPKRSFFSVSEEPRNREELEQKLVELTIEYAKRADVPLKAA